ncbi:MAG: methionyl-tRNA formyltransferase [Planctomycetota bacterium]|jgi:methionyl-tRNA formyltransferase
MRLVYLGSGEFGIDSLNTLLKSNHSLEFIVSQPAQPAGRGRKNRPTPVAQWAQAHSIAFTETADVNAPPIIEKITSYKPELIVVIAFGQKIGSTLTGLPPKGTINVHASLLPKYRGAAPINWPIINGETKTGVSIITVAEKMDAGKILAQSATDIEPTETAGRLHDRLARMAAPLLLETIDKIADGTATYQEQDDAQATLAPKLKKSDGFLDFNDSAESLANRIRGFCPWPGAAAHYISKKTDKRTRLIIAAAEDIENTSKTPLLAGTLDENLNLICGRGALKLIKLKPEGSRLLDFKDFVNGWHCCAGDLFMKIEK